MCNRFENEKSAAELAELIEYPLIVREDALMWEPVAYQAPQASGLCIVEHDDGWALRTAHWGFIHPTLGKPTFNTRTDSAPRVIVPKAYQHEAPESPNPMWRGLHFCWLPATAWLECAQAKTKSTAAVWYRMSLPDGEPLLLAGVCGQRDGKFRMSMMMTEVPGERLPAIRQAHNRMPLVFALDAVGQADPQPVHERVVVTRL